jgi:uncharacterized protein
LSTTLGWIVAIIVALVLLRFAVLALEPALAFFPSRGEDLTPEAAGVAYVAESVSTSDGETLRAWWIPHEQAQAAVVYFHGNGGNLSLWLPIYLDLHARGFSVFAVDYRGYGLSTGRATERGLYLDVEATVAHYVSQYRRDGVPTVYWGRSLGTPMAARATRAHRPDGVVLEAGFPHVRSVLAGQPPLWLLSWLGSYRFPTAEWMAGYDGPVLVLHGTGDGIIPFRAGRALFEQIESPAKRFVPIERGDHNDLVPADPDAYWRAVADFVSGVRS